MNISLRKVRLCDPNLDNIKNYYLLKSDSPKN